MLDQIASEAHHLACLVDIGAVRFENCKRAFRAEFEPAFFEQPIGAIDDARQAIGAQDIERRIGIVDRA